MKTPQLSIFTLLAILTVLLPTATADYTRYTQWQLPEGATARIGKGIIRDTAYSPDGTRLAVATTIGVWLYDARTYREVALISIRSLTAMVFSPDGGMLATAHYGNPIQIWSARSGQSLATFTGYVSDVNALAYSPDGETLAVADASEILLWNARTGEQRAVLQGGAKTIAFSLDGNTLFSVGEDKTIRHWDAGTGEALDVTEIKLGKISDLAFSPDRTLLASSEFNADIIEWWTVQTGQRQAVLKGPERHVDSIQFSPDSRLFASAGSRWDDVVSEDVGEIRVWNAYTGEHHVTLGGHQRWVNSLAFSPDSKTLVSASSTEVLLWDTQTWQLQDTQDRFQGHTRWVESLAFSPDSAMLASGIGNEVWLWNAQTGRLQNILADHWLTVESLAFSPDGQLLASGSLEEVTLQDIATGRYVPWIILHGNWSFPVVFSPNGQTLAMRRFDGPIWLRDVKTGKLQVILEEDNYSVDALVFSSDGKTLAGTGKEGDVWLWDAETGKRHDTLYGHRERGYSLAFSPDGKTLASCSEDWTIRLWNVANVKDGRFRSFLRGHSDAVLSVAFSPDGQLLASGSVDGTVRLWDTDSFRHRATLSGQSDSVTSVAFSPDGRTLASGSGDGTILLWEVPPSPAAFVRIEPSHITAPPIGEALHVNVNISGGKNVRGYQLTVQFKPASLRYVSSTNGDYLPGDAFFIPPIVKGEQVTLISTSPAGVGDGDGTLATLTFEVIGRKTSALTLSEVLLSDSAGKTSESFVQNGWLLEPPWDLNFDGVVNVQDLAIVAAHFGETNAGEADVNQDGVVDIRDLVVVASGLDIAVGAAPESFFLPAATVLLPNYPNPFNPETWIPYRLAIGADVTLTIYDVHGKAVRQFTPGYQPAGAYQHRSRAAYWDGKNELDEPVASGVYFYALTTADFSATRKMLIRR